MNDGELDMRMDRLSGVSAMELVNELEESELADLIYKYGEERASRKIARKIAEVREESEITTSFQLKKIIHSCMGKKTGKIDSSTRTFQALRIAVNNEIEIIEPFLKKCMELLKPGGICSIISFHSLEDRIVKNYIKKESADCLCPHTIIQCVCGHKKILKKITGKPVVAGKQEINVNPRSRSAKLRVFRKI